MNKQTLRRADLVFSYVLMVIATWFFVQSIKLFLNPFGREFELVYGDDIKQSIIEWYKSPALLPMLLSALVFLCAILLMHKARKDGARFDFLTKDKILSFLRHKEFKVSIITIVWMAIYIFIAIPLMRKTINFFPRFQGFPFMIATFLFIFGLMFTFNEKTFKKSMLTLVISVFAAVAITYGFGNLALIPLP